MLSCVGADPDSYDVYISEGQPSSSSYADQLPVTPSLMIKNMVIINPTVYDCISFVMDFIEPPTYHS